MSEVVPIRDCGSSWTETSGLATRLRIELGAISNVYANDLAGYVVIAVDHAGHWTCAWKVADDTPIGRTMLAGLAVAGIQQDMIADRAAMEAIVRNGLREPPPDNAA